MGDNFAARMNDKIIHTSVFADIASIVFEGAVYAAAGAVVAATAVAAAPLLAGAGMATAATAATALGGSCVASGMVAGMMIGAAGLRDSLSKGCDQLANAIFPPSPSGVISSGSTNVLTNGLAAARAAGRLATETEKAAQDEARKEKEKEEEKKEKSLWDYAAMVLNSGTAILSQLADPVVDGPSSAIVESEVDKVACEKHSPEEYLAEGSSTVAINDLPAVRGKDRTTCGATVSTEVSPNVIIGGPPLVVRPIKSGKLPGLELVVMALSLLKGNPKKLFKQLPCMLAMAGGGMLASKLGDAIHAAFNPVHAATGAKVLADEDDRDFSLPARFPLVWQRVYNSRNQHEGMFGRGWRTEFETFITTESGQYCFHDLSGRELRFVPPAPGVQDFYADEGLIIARGEQGQVVVADADGSVWRLYIPMAQKPGVLQLVSLSDEYGNGLMLTYDDSGRLAGLNDTEETLTVSLHYEDSRHPERVTRITEREHQDEQGTTHEHVLAHYRYDANSCLIGVVDACGRTRRSFEWTADALMSAHQLPGGLRCEYRWKKLDDWRVVEQSTSAGEHNVLDYDLDARLTIVTTEQGYTRHHYWNGDFQPVRYTDEAGNDWYYDWNSLGLLAESRDPDGSCWRYCYDAAGNLTEEYDPLGRVTLTSWLEDRALPACVKLPGGGLYRYDYDECHGLTEMAAPEGKREKLERDAFGQITAVRDGSGAVLQRFSFNRRGQITEAWDCSGNKTGYHYDARYRLEEILDATGERWRRKYDATGNVLEISGAEGWHERVDYNERGLPVRHRAADGMETRYGYDDTGWLTSRRNPRGGVVSRRRDSRGRLVELCNENGERWRFVPGPNGRLLEERGFDGALTRFAYDVCDRVVSRTFLADTPSALTWQAKYDAAGQMTALNTPDIERVYQYTVDGALSSAEEIHQDGSRDHLKFDYDGAGRLKAESGINGRVGYQYDEHDNRTVTELPDGRKLRSHYYGSGHLLQIALDSQILSEFNRDALHREVKRTQGALFSLRRYDRLGRMAEISVLRENSPLRAEREWRQQYDMRHNLVENREMTDPWRVRHYRYDETDNLLEARQGVISPEHFHCDPAGNIGESDAAVRHNRVTAFRNVRYQYDDYGRVKERVLAGEIQTLEYDTFHRLVKVTCRSPQKRKPDRDIRYRYDALGRRTEKRVESYPPGTLRGLDAPEVSETRFVWEGLRLLSETQDGRTRLYVYEDQSSYTPLVRVDGQGPNSRYRWYHCQPNGMPERLSDEKGDICWESVTSAWGRTECESGDEEENLRFQGQYLDRETGLHYNLFRYYDPECGRFTQPDPIGLNGGINLYSYGPNPLNWIDPLGLKCWSAARKDFWIREARTNPHRYSRNNLERMIEGKAPKMTVEVFNHKKQAFETKDVSMEVHHRSLPQRGRSPKANEQWNLERATPWGHEAMDPYRHTGYDLIRIITGVNSW
ncbi:RHS repeat protein [Salmonella enterica]|nr:RHS repeat protein [Salmonella enterica]EMA5837588.1 RHS repeat protein [Salmonella enterica]EMA6041705.1 RHS repeat protein [Salmonella enterica]